MTTSFEEKNELLKILETPITPQVLENHDLSSEEFEKIEQLLGRKPNFVELGLFSIMWSEHCSYKSTKELLKKLPKHKANPDAPHQVLVPAGQENAGIVDIGHDHAVCFKMESHNHPTALEPYQGAATGIGGIIRDILSLGARPRLLTNSIRLGSLDDPQTQDTLRKITSGFGHYGNSIGVPNIAGDIYFDPAYQNNPLVNVVSLGLVKHKNIKTAVASGPGNPVFYIGAPTAREGLSSDHADHTAAPQVSDPFLGKRILEASLELMAIPDLLVAVQDMGAGGLTCALADTTSRGNSGIQIHLENVPAREPHLTAYDLLLSETQERILMIVKEGRVDEFQSILRKHEIPHAQIGQVTDKKTIHIQHFDQTITELPPEFLTQEAPTPIRTLTQPTHLQSIANPSHEQLPDITPDTLEPTLLKLLSDPTIAEKRWVWNQFDHMVLAGLTVDPGSDSAVTRLRLGPDTQRFLAISNDCNHHYCKNNPYRGAQIAVAESLRNLACAGAHPIGICDNLNFGNPDNPDTYYNLHESTRGLADACSAFDVPVIGGNVSLNNHHEGTDIPPTPIVAAVGLIHSLETVTRQTVLHGNESLILLGDFPSSLATSRYLSIIHNFQTADAPDLSLDKERNLHAFLRSTIAEGHITAAHDISEGGLLIALLEMLFKKKDSGAQINLSAAPNSTRLDALLFAESQSRAIVATTSPDTLLAAAQEENLPAHLIGQVTQNTQLELKLSTRRYTWNIASLKSAWRDALPNRMLLKP